MSKKIKVPRTKGQVSRMTELVDCLKPRMKIHPHQGIHCEILG